jgi:hypothetical protein
LPCERKYDYHHRGIRFFSHLTDFSFFFYEKKSESCRTLSEQAKMILFERGCRWFYVFLKGDVDGFMYLFERGCRWFYVFLKGDVDGFMSF